MGAFELQSGLMLWFVVCFHDVDCEMVDTVQIRFHVPDIEIFEAAVEVGDVVSYLECASTEENRGGFGVDLARGAENGVVETGRPFRVFYAAIV